MKRTQAEERGKFTHEHYSSMVSPYIMYDLIVGVQFGLLIQEPVPEGFLFIKGLTSLGLDMDCHAATYDLQREDYSKRKRSFL